LLGQTGRILTIALLTAVPFLGPSSPCAAQGADWELWSGVIVRNVRPDSAFDFSAEYQARVNDDLSALKVHFAEANALYKATRRLTVNSGYRYSIRPDRGEHRLFAGLFFRHAFRHQGRELENRRSWLTHQLMYQRDLNDEYNDVLLDSSTVRYAMYFQKRISRHWAPMAVAGALYTWNSEFTGLDKLRIAAGARYIRNNGDRFQMLFVHEKGMAVEPSQHANILWLRYEISF
jgi:hypothetical protein